MRVVATRSLEDLDDYAAALGSEVELVPLPVLVDLPPDGPAVEALCAAAVAGPYDLLWLASARAVAPAVAALQTVGSDPPPAVTVGERTAVAARAVGLSARCLGRDATEAAGALAAEGVAGRAILAPRSAAGRDDGLAILTAAGARVVAVTAYRVGPRAAHDPALVAGLTALPTAAALLVFSPSQAAALAALAPPSGWPPTVAIGATTAAALTARGAPPRAIATTPDPAGMAAALASVYPTAR